MKKLLQASDIPTPAFPIIPFLMYPDVEADHIAPGEYFERNHDGCERYHLGKPKKYGSQHRKRRLYTTPESYTK